MPHYYINQFLKPQVKTGAILSCKNHTHFFFAKIINHTCDYHPNLAEIFLNPTKWVQERENISLEWIWRKESLAISLNLFLNSAWSSLVLHSCFIIQRPLWPPWSFFPEGAYLFSNYIIILWSADFL